jgi:fumarylacetoacetase
MEITTWVTVESSSGLGVANLPYGVFSRRGEPPRVGVAIGSYVLDLARLAGAGLVEDTGWFAAGSLNRFMSAGRAAWLANRVRLTELLTDETHRAATEPHLVPIAETRAHLPFEVGDFVDFYSSRDHAVNAGRIFRPVLRDPLPPNWRHLPIGYHGRAGTVVVSGTPVVRPSGQWVTAGQRVPSYGPSAKLDFEAEVGFVAGVPADGPIPPSAFRDHVFGFVLVNDWSARDIQRWESQPLGPFLGKSFATSVSPWVVPMAALEGARVAPPAQDPLPLDYLRCDEPWGLDLSLRIELNGHQIARPSFASMYWTSPQQLAHATVNGASVRTGDLFASGTVSGPERTQRGCMLELSWDGQEPLDLPDGTRRAFLDDDDTIVISATAPGIDGSIISFGAVSGTVYPSVRSS